MNNATNVTQITQYISTSIYTWVIGGVACALCIYLGIKLDPKWGTVAGAILGLIVWSCMVMFKLAG